MTGGVLGVALKENEVTDGSSDYLEWLFVGVFLVFLVLKLGELGQVADWSWWWVTAPLWVPFALVVLASE